MSPTDAAGQGPAAGGAATPHSGAGWVAPAIVLALGLALNLPFVARLGLWNDDFVQFLQADHVAKGSALAFVFGDSTGFLAGGERPAGYLAFTAARLAYLGGPAALHFLTAVCAALAASLLARFSRHLFADPGAQVATGAFALLWPLAPLVQFYPSTIHFTIGASIAILAAEAALSERRFAPWLAGALHLLAALTLEVYVLAAPAMVVAVLVARVARSEPWRGILDRRRVLAFAAMAAGSLLVVAWRLFVLPSFGGGILRYESQIAPVGEALARAVGQPGALLWPWRAALAESTRLGISGSRSPRLAAVIALATTAAFVLHGRAERRRLRDDIAEPGSDRFAWLPGLLLASFWLVQLAFVPGAFEGVLGLSSRLKYPAASAAGLTLGGLFATLAGARACSLRRVAAHVLLFAVLWSGGRIHETLARAHAEDWIESRDRIAQIATACPSPVPGTLFLVESDWPWRLVSRGKEGMSHDVLSAVLIARYDDPTLQGVSTRHARVTKQGLRILNWGRPQWWFPSGDYGLIALRAREALPSIPRDRVVLIARGANGELGLVASLGLSVERGRRAEVANRPERCGSVISPPSPAFCRAFTEACPAALR